MSQPAKIIEPLTQSQGRKLRKMMKSHLSTRTRVRAHAVLISAKGYSIKEVADLLEVSRESVSSWLSAWKEGGAEALEEGSSPGRPRKLTEEHVKRLQELMKEDPRNVVGQFLNEYEQENGEPVSSDTVRRVLHEIGAVWKRFRKSLRDKRDEQAFRRGQRRLRKLLKRADAGEIYLYYYDEAAFSLEPNVPYAWGFKGETLELPTSGGSSLSVLGFLRHDSEVFHCITVEGSVDSGVVAQAFDSFKETVKHKRKPIIVVLDNAPTHRSVLFSEKVKKLFEMGISCFFLPPYSPELNRIEILWRHVKYHWIPLSAYSSLTALKQSLNDILAAIGKEYKILFA